MVETNAILNQPSKGGGLINNFYVTFDIRWVIIFDFAVQTEQAVAKTKRLLFTIEITILKLLFAKQPHNFNIISIVIAVNSFSISKWP